MYTGQSPYNIPVFFQELMRELSKVDLEAADVKKIQDAATLIYNAKVKDEKAKAKGKQKSKKPTLAGGKAVNERNNNPGMITDLCGDEDEYGAEAKAFEKEAEEEIDFM